MTTTRSGPRDRRLRRRRGRRGRGPPPPRDPVVVLPRAGPPGRRPRRAQARERAAHRRLQGARRGQPGRLADRAERCAAGSSPPRPATTPSPWRTPPGWPAPRLVVMPTSRPRREARRGRGPRRRGGRPRPRPGRLGRPRPRAGRSATGSRWVSPGDDPAIVLGHATLHLELFRAHPDLEVLFVPIGSGTSAAGACLVRDAVAPALPRRRRAVRRRARRPRLLAHRGPGHRGLPHPGGRPRHLRGLRAAAVGDGRRARRVRPGLRRPDRRRGPRARDRRPHPRRGRRCRRARRAPGAPRRPGRVGRRRQRRQRLARGAGLALRAATQVSGGR